MSSERGQLALGAIETASERAASLTSQLLTFARRQSVNPQTVDVADRVAAVREVLSSALGGAIKLNMDIQPDLWPVFVDPNEFETALINLVVNARDAMPNGGTLTVSARNVPETNEVAASVADTGEGIPEDVLSKVFDPFLHHQAGRQRDRPRTVPGPRICAPGRRPGRDNKHARQGHDGQHLPAARDRGRKAHGCGSQRARLRHRPADRG